jgi:hypothetical protein
VLGLRIRQRETSSRREPLMECNLSNWERGIRIGIGVGLLSVGLFAGLTGWQAAMADSLGAIALFTGAAGFCPVWNVFGIDTCGGKHSSDA